VNRQDRRTFLRGTAGAVGALGVLSSVGASTDVAATAGSSERSPPYVEVVVGPAGELVFDPELTRITPETTVVFVLESDNHNVVVDEQPDGADWEGTPGGSNELYDTGYEYEHTFETAGRYEFYCAPHRGSGMEGTIEVVEPDVTVTVGPDGELLFEPGDFEIEQGSSVLWKWESDDHNVVPDQMPDDAVWEGSPGAPEETYDAGYEYVHTFDVRGTYEYHCEPHVGAGMEGRLDVVDPDATQTPTGTTTSETGDTAGDEESNDTSNGSESIPFSAPAVVGTSALAGGALARLRRRFGDRDD